MSSGGPGEAHRGREELRLGLGVGLVCSAKAAEGGGVTVPSRRGPRLSVGPQEGQVGSARARPLPHSGRPRLRAVNLVPSPAGRRHRPLLERPRAWRVGGRKCWTPVPAPFQPETPPCISVTLSPRFWGSWASWCEKSDDPTPQLWRIGLSGLLLPAPNPQSLFSRGRGAGRGDSCADDAPPPRAPRTRAPRSPHAGLGADPHTRADGLGRNRPL